MKTETFFVENCACHDHVNWHKISGSYWAARFIPILLGDAPGRTITRLRIMEPTTNLQR